MAPQVSSREHHDVVQILLVDDQPRNLETLEAMLDGADLRLVRASSADEALLALLQEQFAAIVLDIRMPGTSGFELATFIKQRKRTQHVPILFLTAHMADEQEICGATAPAPWTT
jgi:CheY-like chemotaxis protein